MSTLSSLLLVASKPFFLWSVTGTDRLADDDDDDDDDEVDDGDDDDDDDHNDGDEDDEVKGDSRVVAASVGRCCVGRFCVGAE